MLNWLRKVLGPLPQAPENDLEALRTAVKRLERDFLEWETHMTKLTLHLGNQLRSLSAVENRRKRAAIAVDQVLEEAEESSEGSSFEEVRRRFLAQERNGSGD